MCLSFRCFPQDVVPAVSSRSTGILPDTRSILLSLCSLSKPCIGLNSCSCVQAKSPQRLEYLYGVVSVPSMSPDVLLPLNESISPLKCRLLVSVRWRENFCRSRRFWSNIGSSMIRTKCVASSSKAQAPRCAPHPFPMLLSVSAFDVFRQMCLQFGRRHI